MSETTSEDTMGCLLVIFVVALFFGVWGVAGFGWACLLVAAVTGALFFLGLVRAAQRSRRS